MGAPRVSIVTATYNRSAALACAIRSVRAQSERDWEQIVVGDACTDDSAGVVAGFADARIRFSNLPANAGEQSVPNNHGVTLARGRYLAFLNHDDLWLPDHLAQMIGALESTGADLVFPYIALMLSEERPILATVSRSGGYEPLVAVPASGWVMRATAAERVGPWRSFRETHQVPSQDWLHRAHRAGVSIKLVPAVTLIIFPSGMRTHAYVGNEAREQQRCIEQIESDPGFRERLLTNIAANQALEGADALSTTAVWPYMVRATRNGVRRVLSSIGVSPVAARMVIRGRQRGWQIDELRKTRGLPALGSKRE